MVKPEIQGTTKRDPLPKGRYTAIITGYRHVDRANAQTGNERWDASEKEFYEKDKAEWPQEQRARQLKAEEEGKKYTTRPWPAHRQFQYWWSMKVVEGEHRDRYLPRKKTTVMLSSFELNGLFKFLKAIKGIEGEYDSLAKRIDSGDAPDFDEEVVGKCVEVKLSVNDKGYPKIDWIDESDYEPTPEDIAELVLGASVKSEKIEDLEDDIPF